MLFHSLKTFTSAVVKTDILPSETRLAEIEPRPCLKGVEGQSQVKLSWDQDMFNETSVQEQNRKFLKTSLKS